MALGVATKTCGANGSLRVSPGVTFACERVTLRLRFGGVMDDTRTTAMKEQVASELGPEAALGAPRVRLAGQLCSAYASGVGIWAVGCWSFNWPRAMLWYPADQPIVPQLALICATLGFSLWANLIQRNIAIWRRVAATAGALALALAVWALLEAVASGHGATPRPRAGHAADLTLAGTLRPALASVVVLGGCCVFALALFLRPRGWLARVAGLFGATLAVFHFVALVTIMYQVRTLRWAVLWPESFLAATAMLAIALALVASAGTQRLPLRPLWQKTSQAHLLRMFVPVSVALVLFAEVLTSLIGWHWSLSADLLQAMHLLLPVAVVLAAGIVLARQVGKELDRAQASLVTARDELEQRVLERTADLTRANKELQDEICSRVLAEAAYKESMANFTALGDLVPALVIVQQDGRCVYANQMAAESVGCAREDLIGGDALEFVHPDFRRVIQDHTLRRQAGEDVPSRYEFPLVARGGEVRWVDSSAQRIHLRNEPAVLICALDVTQRKEAEQKLAASEERFRQVVENIREVFWMTDPSKRELMYISRAFESVWGRDRQDAQGSSLDWLACVHPEDRERVQKAMARLETHGRYEEIYRIVRPDGLVRWIQDRAFPIFNERGEIYRIAGIAEDITAWKATEESLRSSEERFRTLFEVATIGIALLGPDGQYLRVNRVYCELLGYSEVELLRLGTTRVTHPEDVAQGQQFYRELAEGARDHYSREMRLVTKPGQVIHAVAASSAVRDATGALRYIVSALLDISERKRLQNEVLEISSRERRRIGHDLHDGLGQYLSGIAFKAKCLEETLHAEAPGRAADAQELVRLLNNAVSQARTLARGLDPVEAEVGGLVPALHKLADESAKLFSLECGFESNLPEVTLDTGVALHLFRIAQEAITNAARHGNARRIAVRLYAGAHDLRLGIEDNGCGFTVGQRTEAGLGLRTMQYRAETINAAFQVQSSPGKGTSVECVLPLAKRT